ncbi:phosphatase PAP2 family protein [Nocardioides sp. GCM10027113]|uniref:phosphatase PAP2 family protein n=1 Tax=unclassified Nocardioides TaxID=2615069 RepID=UPI00361C4D33
MDISTRGVVDVSRAVRRSPVLWVTTQAVVVVLGVFVYFRTRGLNEGSSAVAEAHARDIVALERTLGIHVEAELQAVVAPSATLETFANWVYIWGHWPVIVTTMVWLVWRHRDVFLRLRDGMLVSGALGLVVFVTYPVAPPRLMDLGLVDTVTESSQAYRVLQPPAFTNQYAAMPSLHSGWDLLVGIAIVTAATTTALKVVGYTLPVLMGLAVVATANHYVLDVVAGVALALLGHVAALYLERRRHRRTGHRPGHGAPS